MLFVLAAITDYFDGEIARRWSLITDFGKLMDPLVDKIMTAAAFVCLVPLQGDPGVGGHHRHHPRIPDHRVCGCWRFPRGESWRRTPSASTRLLADRHRDFFPRAARVPGVRASVRRPRARCRDWQALWTYGGWTVSGIAVVLTIYSGVGLPVEAPRDDLQTE